MVKLIKIFLVVMLVALVGCGQQSGSSSSDDPDTPSNTGDSVAVSYIALSTAAATIGTGDSVTITARLLNSSGQLISSSKTVDFTLSAPSLGAIGSPITTSSGILNTTLAANNIEGTLTVTATVAEDSISSNPLAIEISNALAANSITLVANPSTITVGGTSVVTATVVDSNNNPMQSGTNVNFSVDNSNLGTIVTSASVSGTSGQAQATFSAGTTTAGTATVTATSGSATNTIAVIVTGADAGSIEFDSATPQIVVIKGSGGDETSVVKFLVKDTNGDPVLGSQTVHMTLSGPNGGEYIGSTVGATAVDVGTVNGYATTVLHSGTIPGTVTINATVTGTTLSTSSGVIAIGGGVPSEGHFSVSTTKLNLEGFDYAGITASITARIADRYGNFNVLEGTSVSFYSECGAIDRAVNLDSEGEGSVQFRTQQPMPEDVVPSLVSTAIIEREQDVISDYLSYFNEVIDDTNNPRDGLCTLVAVVDGEEEFTDSNADGLYNSGESFDDTYDDIHLDMDDDSQSIAYGTETAGFPYDASFEDLIVDRNQDGTFDGMNNVWDSNKRISQYLDILYTGEPVLSVGSNGLPLGFLYISDGGSQVINFSLHDARYNPPISGTKITVTCDVGKLTGTTNTDYLDTNVIGAPIYTFILSDSAVGDTNAPARGTLKFSWTYKGDNYSVSYLVTVD